jgi:hypothetical protein
MLLDQTYVATAMQRLADDLATGRWHSQHAGLLDLDQFDLGYRLVVT